jgi:hypothetical protein
MSDDPTPPVAATRERVNEVREERHISVHYARQLADKEAVETFIRSHMDDEISPPIRQALLSILALIP